MANDLLTIADAIDDARRFSQAVELACAGISQRDLNGPMGELAAELTRRLEAIAEKIGVAMREDAARRRLAEKMAAVAAEREGEP